MKLCTQIVISPLLQPDQVNEARSFIEHCNRILRRLQRRFYLWIAVLRGISVRSNRTRAKPIASGIACAALLAIVTVDAQPLNRMAAGGNHSAFIANDGSLWTTGFNSYGQLGDATFNDTNRPEQILNSGVISVAAGCVHTIFLKSDGSLWAMGDQEYGQLGDGIYTYLRPWGTNSPEPIATNVRSIAAGWFHSMFIKNDGSLWGMGRNGSGELGIGTNDIGTNRPVQVVSSGVTAIAAGTDYSLFVKDDGTLWAMGYNSDGQLGDGTGNVYTNLPERIVSGGVTAVAAGFRHSLFLRDDGSLWAMGQNIYGQLGDGTYSNAFVPELIVSNGVTAIAAGGYCSLFLKVDGTLWGMGLNGSGQLGDGTYSNRNTPQMIAGSVMAMAAGYQHNLFSKTDGSLWAMGKNSSGQLGDGTYNQTNQPEQIVAGPVGYNQISIQTLSPAAVRLSFTGIASRNYALERSSSFDALDWEPQSTNAADGNGLLVITNSVNQSVNAFWRVRSLQ